MDVFSEMARFCDATINLERLTSYARALKTAIKRHDFEIDGMRFIPAGATPDSANAVTGTHSMFYILEGTEKLYRVTVEPVQETHR